jgi:putative spermidine/putrescine transport system permease protein
VAALSQLPPALLESSASLGASRAYTFRRITLPLIAPGIAAGAFIAFMSSFDNVPVSLFLRDASTDMLPIRMWQDLEGKLDVSIAAVSSLMVLGTLTGISKRIR